MYEVSDDIQNLAEAFAERIALEAAMNIYNSCKDPQTKDCLLKIIRLHCICVVKKNLGWYMTKGVIVNKSVVYDLEDHYQRAVQGLVTHINDIVEGFDLPKIK